MPVCAHNALPSEIMWGLQDGKLLTTTDVAALFGRETRSVKRWLLKSTFPKPEWILTIRSGRKIRVWRRSTLEQWFGRPLAVGEIFTTADMALYIGKEARDIKRYLADGSFPEPRRIVEMHTRNTKRRIRLWHKAEIQQWYFGEEDEEE
jgi:predicted DNA-binding transcriptional regulator AlpA